MIAITGHFSARELQRERYLDFLTALTISTKRLTHLLCCRIIRARPAPIEALTAQSNVETLAAQARSLHPKLAVIGDPALYFWGVADKIHLEYTRRAASHFTALPLTLQNEKNRHRTKLNLDTGAWRGAWSGFQTRTVN